MTDDMNKYEQMRKDLDKIVCWAIDTDIPYEEVSAPLLDWSWLVVGKIIQAIFTPSQIEELKKGGEVKVSCVDQTAPCTELNENSPPNKGVITQDYLNGRKSMLDADFCRVV